MSTNENLIEIFENQILVLLQLENELNTRKFRKDFRLFLMALDLKIKYKIPKVVTEFIRMLQNLNTRNLIRSSSILKIYLLQTKYKKLFYTELIRQLIPLYRNKNRIQQINKKLDSIFDSQYGVDKVIDLIMKHIDEPNIILNQQDIKVLNLLTLQNVRNTQNVSAF